ncbi:MAG: hypothetical protein ACK4SS_03135 [Cypionkella sp.]
MPSALVERADGPDSLAGAVLAQRLYTQHADPLLPALRHAGVMATLRLMSSGALPQDALAGYGLALSKTSAPPPDAAALLAAFAEAQITTAPYAALANLPDLAAMPNPAPNGSSPPVLDDAAFLGLQYICDG